MRALVGLVDSTRTFSHPLVGNQRMNRAGLHLGRMFATDVAFASRRVFTRAPFRDALSRDGFAVIANYLPAPLFERLREEVHDCVAALRTHVPYPAPVWNGFGPKLPFAGGFDRHDGTALNRFVAVSSTTLPVANAVVDERLAPECGRLAGMLAQPQKYWIQELVHTADGPDIQKTFHRDTFHQALKLWYFIDEVTGADGPFMYVPGSHRLDRARLRWEYQQSVQASVPGAATRGGAFRVSAEELRALGCRAPIAVTVPANTLVIANIRGFHRRGDVRGGVAHRLAIHASLRPSPFVPVPYR